MTEKNETPSDWQQRRHCEAIPWSQLGSMPEQEALIEDLLFCGSLSMVYGDSNTGKTFVVLWFAACIALGWDWIERKSKQGKVVLLATEAGLSIKPRLDAIRVHYGLGEDALPPLYIIPDMIDIGKDGRDTDTIIAEIKAIGSVELVIVDTMNRAIAGGDENTPTDMGGFINNCDKIRNETGAHVLIVHHSGKDASRGARGHSSLRAAVDTEINVTNDDGLITAKVTKQRNTSTGNEFHMMLQEVEIGHHEDGKAQTSCILVAVDAPTIVEAKPTLSRQTQRALDILHNCLAEQGEEREAQKDQPPVLCITLDEFREALRAGRIANTDKADSMNKAINRAVENLTEVNVAKVFDQFIWIPDKTDNTGQTE